MNCMQKDPTAPSRGGWRQPEFYQWELYLCMGLGALYDKNWDLIAKKKYLDLDLQYLD